MTFNQKDLLKFALELYERTREMGLMDIWGKNSLESLLEVINSTNLAGLIPSQIGKGKEIQQEKDSKGSKTDQVGPFWNQETSFSPAGSPGFNAAGGSTSPISIFETVSHVNVYVILPDVASLDDITLSVSEEIIELYLDKGPANVDVKKNFNRIIRLPAAVDPSRTTATCRNGFIYISAPKKAYSSTKKVKIEF